MCASRSQSDCLFGLTPATAALGPSTGPSGTCRPWPWSDAHVAASGFRSLVRRHLPADGADVKLTRASLRGRGCSASCVGGLSSRLQSQAEPLVACSRGGFAAVAVPFRMGTRRALLVAQLRAAFPVRGTPVGAHLLPLNRGIRCRGPICSPLCSLRPAGPSWPRCAPGHARHSAVSLQSPPCPRSTFEAASLPHRHPLVLAGLASSPWVARSGNRRRLVHCGRPARGPQCPGKDLCPALCTRDAVWGARLTGFWTRFTHGAADEFVFRLLPACGPRTASRTRCLRLATWLRFGPGASSLPSESLCVPTRPATCL